MGAILGLRRCGARRLVRYVDVPFVDLLMAIPTLIFGLVVLSVLPSTLVTLVLVMGILGKWDCQELCARP
ncbi:hypothetical protein NKI19_32345 [Mesorhizobium sp. M0751]|uniref:hypothetical protein n=1 Tax=unclassified Mesorhizobium TaxID=325217 RepID=UPI00333D12CD